MVVLEGLPPAAAASLLELAEEIVGVVGEGLEALAGDGLGGAAGCGGVGRSGIVIRIDDVDGGPDFFQAKRQGEFGGMGCSDAQA